MKKLSSSQDKKLYNKSVNMNLEIGIYFPVKYIYYFQTLNHCILILYRKPDQHCGQYYSETHRIGLFGSYSDILCGRQLSFILDGLSVVRLSVVVETIQLDLIFICRVLCKDVRMFVFLCVEEYFGFKLSVKTFSYFLTR